MFTVGMTLKTSLDIFYIMTSVSPVNHRKCKIISLLGLITNDRKPNRRITIKIPTNITHTAVYLKLCWFYALNSLNT